MSGNNTPILIAQLVPELVNIPDNRPEQLRGALEGLLTPSLGAGAARAGRFITRVMGVTTQLSSER